MTYDFLQHYWCFVVALLGALLASLLFVQGVNAVGHILSYSDESRRIIYNSIGRRWRLTFATLVAFGGVFFASFPLFFSAFRGAYWLWLILLLTFVFQAASYVFQDKAKHQGIFRFFLTLNGYVGPMLLGSIVATFFEGASFYVKRGDLAANTPIVSYWANASHGLDILINPWVLIFSVAVFFLARILGLLFLLDKVADDEVRGNGHGRLIAAVIHFVGLFTIFFVHLLLKDGYTYNEMGYIFVESNKYLANFKDMWYLSVLLIAGVTLVLYSAIKAIINRSYGGSICFAATGAVCTVLALMLCAMWNHTAYYPSTEDLQSSLTIANSCSSESVLKNMFYGSLVVPFVLAYAIYRWHTVGNKE